MAPTAVTSANELDPNLKAPITQSLVAGIDRELMPNLALQLNYSYTRTSRTCSAISPARMTPRVGVTLADYAPGAGLAGTLPDGTAYSIPTFIPNAAKVAAGGSGFLTTNIPDYYTDYHGLEIGMVKRLSNKWMAPHGPHREQRARALHLGGGHLRHERQSDADADRAAEGRRPVRAAERRQRRRQRLHQRQVDAQRERPVSGADGIEVSGNVFGRQGYPYPLFRQGSTAALGGDSTLSVLVVPAIDYLRYPNLWNTDLRVARTFKAQRVSVRLIGDVFNAFNANTVLVAGTTSPRRPSMCSRRT